jgi:tetratricopeptide (TPR) repeat protein
MSSVSAEVEYQGGGVAAVDVELDELELSSPPQPMAIARGGRRDSANPGFAGAHRGDSASSGFAGARGGAERRGDSIDDFDPDELIGHGNGMAHGSPAPSRPPQAPSFHTDNFELDFEPSPSQATRQMSPEHAEQLANMGMADEELDDPVIVDHNPSATWSSSLDEAVDAQLDDEAIGVEIDSEVAAAVEEEDLPFDPAAARAFDAAVAKGGGYYETPPTATPIDTASYDQIPHDAAASGTYDPYGTEAVQTPSFDPTSAHTIDSSHIDHVEHAEPMGSNRNEGVVEDDLDEADFYVGQAMYNEAREVLVSLLERYPNHPLILAKLRDVETLVAQEPAHHEHEIHADSIVEEEADAGGTDAIDLDEIEEVDAADFEEVESSIEAQPISNPKRKPSVMLEKPVDEGDADTHYDLGLAYKEMGLFDEAMKAFEKVIRAPGREVQCRVMIGMCHREQGNPSEAIHQFKQGLHAEPTDRERMSLYYEIGITYEAIGDEAEALYYFESVTKRDPGFADAALRADQLRGRVGRGAVHDDDL